MSIQGMDALVARLKAIGEPQPLLRALQISVIEEAQALVPRKSGHLQASIVPGEVTEISARVVVNANYGIYVERGTGLYGPKKKRIGAPNAWPMHWKGGGPAKVRLSGRSRIRKGKSLSDDVHAWSTEGMRAEPFLEPGARKAVEKSGLVDILIKLWNGAA